MYQAKKKNAETFRLKAEAVKEIFKKDAAVRVKLYSTVIEKRKKNVRKTEPMDIKKGTDMAN